VVGLFWGGGGGGGCWLWVFGGVDHQKGTKEPASSGKGAYLRQSTGLPGAINGGPPALKPAETRGGYSREVERGDPYQKEDREILIGAPRNP